MFKIHSSSHVTRMRCSLVFQRRTQTIMHTVKRVGSVIFQLESGVSLKVVGVMNDPRLSGNLLSVSTLEDEEYEVEF